MTETQNKKIGDMPLSEQSNELYKFVVAEFRRELLLEPEYPLDVNKSFYDLGLTSLKLQTIKQNLESALDCHIRLTGEENKISTSGDQYQQKEKQLAQSIISELINNN